MIIFESFINFFQSVVFAWYLLTMLERKKKYGSRQIFFIFLTVNFAYLEMQSFLTDFEGNWALLLLLLNGTISIWLYSADYTKIVIHNAIVIFSAIFSAGFGGSIVGALHHMDYAALAAEDSVIKGIAMLLSQIIWVYMLLSVRHSFRNPITEYDKKYAYMSLAVPGLSVFLCTAALNIVSAEGHDKEKIVLFILAGIVGLNVVNFLLMRVEHHQYENVLKQQMAIQAYEQQISDIEEIKRQYTQVEKNRHEIKHVVETLESMIKDNNNQLAMEYLEKLDEKKLVQLENKFYSNHVVLNYILNRKLEECKKNEIDVSCLVAGKIEGIDDVDLNIILGNLLDNAIEASVQSTEKKMYITITATDLLVNIEIGNSAVEEAFKDGFNMKTTKRAKSGHGYGISNAKDVVEEYNGILEYRKEHGNMVICNAIFLKKRDSR